MGSTNTVLTHRWFEEVWNQGKQEAIEELLADHAIAHGFDGTVEPRPAKEQFYQFWTSIRQAMTDIRIDVHEVIAEGDSTAARFSFTAKHTGPYMGAEGTGKVVRSSGMSFFHWEGGKIIKGWNEFDALGLTVQTGAIRILANQ